MFTYSVVNFNKSRENRHFCILFFTTTTCSIKGFTERLNISHFTSTCQQGTICTP